MMNMDKHVEEFVDFCKNNLDFSKGVEYKYRSISVCILDCVFSLQTKYAAAKNVVKRYADLYLNGDENASGDGISDLIRRINEAGGPETFSEKAYLKNRQLSGGVRKTAICLQLAKYLQYLKIESLEDFKSFDCPELLEIVIRSVKGMGDAGTNYLFMLAGDQNRCKPDVHIHHCIELACKKRLNNEECQILFRKSVNILKRDYPNLTVAMLDGIIWRKYQSNDR